MIDILLERLRTGYYLTNVMTEGDFFLIKHNEILSKEFANFLASKDNIKLNFEFYSYDLNNYIEETILNLSNDYNDSEKVNIVFNIMKIFSKYNFDITDTEYFYTSGFINENLKNIINEKVVNYILTTNSEIKFEETDENINFILDNKRYDLLSKVNVNNISLLSSEVKERLNKEFPFESMEIPGILLFRNDCFRIDNVKIDEVFDTIDRHSLDLSATITQPKYAKKLEKGIIDFFNDIATKDVTINQKNQIAFSNIVSNISSSKGNFLDNFSKDTLIALVKKGLLNGNLYSYILYKKYMPKEELNELFFKILEKSDDPNSFLDICGQIIDNSSYENSSKDPETYYKLLNRLIENGYGLYMYNMYDLSTEQINRIISSISDGKNKINTLNPLKMSKISKNKELANYIYRNMNIEKINYERSQFSFDPDSINIIKGDENYNIFKAFILKNKCESNFMWFDQDLINMYLELNDNYPIISIYNRCDSDEKKLFEKWFETQTNNFSFLHDLMACSFVNMNIIKIASKNEELIDYTMDFIIHNDGYIEKLDREIFDSVKNYYSRKYSLNLKNMELLMDHFGPKIIIHLEDDNIKRLINLDEQDLIKIINIFPMECSLVDVEATYESIMQYAFKQDENNNTYINIFALLKKSIVDRNLNDIEKYKYIIMSLVDINYYNKLKEKNSELKDLSLEKALDYLINNFYNDDLREILHSLTNNAIVTKRKQYICNNYYKESEEFEKSELNYINKRFHSLNRDSADDISKIWVDVSYLMENVSKEFLMKYLEKYNLSQQININQLIVNNFKTSESYKAESMFNELFENAISYKKANSKKDYSVFAELGIDYTFDEKSKKNEIEKELIRNCKFYRINYATSLSQLIIKDLIENGISKELAEDTISYYRNPESDISSDIEEVKKTIKLLFRSGTKIIRENYDKILDHPANKEISNDKNNDSSYFNITDRIKRIYNVDIAKKDVYTILGLLNIDLIKDNLLTDDKKYDLLVKIFNKTKPHLLSKGVFDLIEKNELPITNDIQDISSYINFFSDIIIKESENKNIEENLPSIINVLLQSGVYASVNSVYSKILGVEDSKLIKQNPGNNSATRKTKNNQRLNEAIDDTINCYKRKEILIPTFDETIETDGGKALDVIVGNFTSPCNITHGERTGACMRIGGAGEELYKFCLYNKAGFHIRFEDPDTNKYISRVSGFRNGNTVYLNQLRDSLNKKYTNNDLINITKKVAEKLIEMSKDSDYPIDNVFVTKGYATADMKDDYKLDYNIIKKGLGSIYTDYSYDNAILLASTAKEGYVPLSSGNNNIKSYKVQRTKPRIYLKSKDASSIVNRIDSIKQLLEGVPVDELTSDNFETFMSYAIATDDWYIYVDNNFQIKSDCINDGEALMEKDKYMKIVMNMISKGEIKEVNYGL